MNTKLENTTEAIMTLFPFMAKNLLKSSNKNKPVHLFSPKNRAVMILNKFGPMPVSELGKKLCISKPNMTSLTDSLIKEGLLIRNNDETDRRIVKISVTKSGTKLAEKMFLDAKDNVKENLSGLNEKDLEDLCTAIMKIKSILSKSKGVDENGSKNC